MRSDLILALQDATGIDNWNSITFGILPNESPKGFIFPSNVNPVSKTQSIEQWAIGIAVSGNSLGSISDTCMSISDSVLSAFQNPVVCTSGVGLIQLVSEINIEFPQSYSNQGNVSVTSGFFTAISFILEVR